MKIELTEQQAKDLQAKLRIIDGLMASEYFIDAHGHLIARSNVPVPPGMMKSVLTQIGIDDPHTQEHIAYQGTDIVTLRKDDVRGLLIAIQTHIGDNYESVVDGHGISIERLFDRDAGLVYPISKYHRDNA